MSCAAGQRAGPSNPPSWNVPSGCTQAVPINIVVFHRRTAGRGSRPQTPLSRSCTPAPALPGGSEDGASIQLAGGTFLSLGAASNIVASHTALNPSQSATPGSCSSENALQPNSSNDEASKTGNETEATRFQQPETTDYCNSHATEESVAPENNLETQVQHSQESTIPVAEGFADDRMHMYQPKQKRSKTKIRQSERAPLSTRERTLAQIEMQISGSKQPETFRNETTPVRNLKTRRKKHRPKVIREVKKATVHKTVGSTPDGKSPQPKTKRSYIRKKRKVGSLEKCSGPVSDQWISEGTRITARRTALVRRSLQFGVEEQTGQRDHTLTASSHHHSIKKLVHAESSELNHTTSDGFACLGRSLPDLDPTSQMSKVSTVENHTHRNNDESSTAERDSIILRTAAEMLAFCRDGGIKKKRSSRIRRNSFSSVMDLQNNPSQASTGLSQQCMDALYESRYIKFITRKRSQKVRPQCSSTIEPNLELKNRLSTGSIFYDDYSGPKISEEAFHKYSPWTLNNQKVSIDIHGKAPVESPTSTSTLPYIDLQGVSSELQHLDLNTEQVHRSDMNLSMTMPSINSFGGIYDLSNALVPYGGRMVVPYERPFRIVKRRRPRAKVDLDVETTRVWNLLMGKNAEPVDGTDVEKERWWQQERKVFQGRANSFIARMRLVQGDRRFSPWKGSVVDSVVGVFLTQNVADHLSSSAFMALAATFPSQSVNSSSKYNTAPQDNGQTISASDLGGKNMFDLFYNGDRPNLAVNCEDLSVNYKNIHKEPEDNSSADGSIKAVNYYFNYKTENASVFNRQGTGMEHEAQQMSDYFSVELNGSTDVLQQMQVQSEISSSQIITLETLQSSSFTSGVPRNFVDGSVADYQQQGKKFDHGKSLTGNGIITSEIEFQRLKRVAINGAGFGKSEASDSMMSFCSTIDCQQLDLRNEENVSSTSPNCSSGSASPYLKVSKDVKANHLFTPCDSHVAERSGNKTATAVVYSQNTSTELPVDHDKQTTSFEAPDMQENELHFVMDEMVAEPLRKDDECASKSGFTSYNGIPDTEAQASRPKKTRTISKKNTENFDWDRLRRQVCREGNMKERSFERQDSVDWEAVRCADVQRISHAIRERGMNNILAERIQNFLNRLAKDHGSIDLEWLRDIPPDSAKEFLLSIRGLGLKSVECVRLLTLHHLAFPVDTNVGRICVRLGWVPIQPLPESLQLHLLELYPVLETIQKYLWPRLCKLDQETLYELHYHMITFGKVFCTKSKPNCNACPLRSECKHFASAYASTRLALPAAQEKSLVKSSNKFAFESCSISSLNSSNLPRLEGSIHAREFIPKNPEPIIEEPASPREEECPATTENDIEDFDEDGEIPTIKLNMEAFAQNLENCIKESNKELQSDDIAKALVAISNAAASIPLPKLKNVHRLRTEHCVYELQDSHPIVQQLELDQRELDDPSPYLLAIWTPGEIKEINNSPKLCCDPQVEGELCNNELCHNCITERQNQSRYVRGTILVPCRTAMRGSFPLNGTYFQVNEVFADHKSSHNPIHVERKQIWNLQRRMVFFGTSVPTIFKGLTTEEIQQCFWRGFVCVRGFDREFRAPRPLCPHLHVIARPRSRKTAATEQVH